MRAGRYPYRLVNVFAESPFSGTSVAVFSDARRLDDDSMARIARELNLPQCTFVFPPELGGSRPRVRIFTPLVELPRAGLPMIATVFAMDLDRRVQADPPSSRDRVVLDQSEGPISVAVFTPVLTVRQNLPVFGSIYPERETIAALLSLRADQLGASPLEVASSGVPYLMVPIKNVNALSQAKVREAIWERTLQYFEAPNIVAFSVKNTAPGMFAHMRVFTPLFGVREEPASENACGPLVGYVLKHGLAALPDSTSLMLRQGEDVGRPSTLHVAAEVEGTELTGLRVGGQCIMMGEGVIYV